LKAPHSKCGILARVSWVRIPPSPPTALPKAFATTRKKHGVAAAFLSNFAQFNTIQFVAFRRDDVYLYTSTNVYRARAMAQTLDRLSQTKVTHAKTGVWPDGGGLYLQVTDGGSKSWFFRFTRGGRERRCPTSARV
jgi:hypothetical protein